MVLVQAFYKTSKTKTLQSSPNSAPKSLINPRHTDIAQSLHFYCKRLRNSQTYTLICLSVGHLGTAQGFAAASLLWQKATALAEHLLPHTSVWCWWGTWLSNQLSQLTN